jgi:hypothetical protein
VECTISRVVSSKALNNVIFNYGVGSHAIKHKIGVLGVLFFSRKKSARVRNYLRSTRLPTFTAEPVKNVAPTCRKIAAISTVNLHIILGSLFPKIVIETVVRSFIG